MICAADLVFPISLLFTLPGTLLMESLSDVLHDYPYLQRKRYQTNYQYK